MHSSSLDPWTHEHVFLGVGHARNERRTWLVVGLTATMMIAEIAGGIVFGSMALLADGWHMSTHAAALQLPALPINMRGITDTISALPSVRGSSATLPPSRAPSRSA